MSSVSVPKLQVRGISKHFHGDQGSVQVLDDISLEAASGEFVSIIGPSGCGKSTLFNILTGLLEPDSGSIALDGKPVADLRGRVGYMLQRDLLMPWRTVLDNVIVGLEVRGTPRAESVERAREYLHTFGLLQFQDSYPKALSGGMRQRVALARTLLPDPDVLLLDEPFSALDYQTRLFLETMLADTARRQGKTVVLVTHDIGEAIAMTDRVIVLSRRPGRLKSQYRIHYGDGQARPTPFQARSRPEFNTYFKQLWDELDVHVEG